MNTLECMEKGRGLMFADLGGSSLSFRGLLM